MSGSADGDRNHLPPNRIHLDYAVSTQAVRKRPSCGAASPACLAWIPIIYAVNESELGRQLSGQFTPLSAYSFMAFVLLYVPCLATVAVIRREVGSAKLTWVASLYGLFVAYGVSFVIYQTGLLLGFS
ncbi:hypothetical protein CEK62_19240 [Alcanivorax sp. N3-2A]|nr:hypothetical protein CEK62_19240 [Alcanivorax sp. N3-2A]